MARTGHRSVESLQHYVGMTTSSERRHEARLLESALQGTTASTLSQSRRSVIQEAGQGDGNRTMQCEESLLYEQLVQVDGCSVARTGACSCYGTH